MMAILRAAFLIFYMILISNVTLYGGADNNESVMEESTCHVLQEPLRYSVIVENANFSEELGDEGISIVELPLQGTLETAKCYVEPRYSELLKEILSPTCAPEEEEQI